MILRALNDLVYRICKGIALFCMVALFCLLLANVVIRFFGLHIKMSWYSEMAEILFAYMVFSMAAALGHEKAHFKVDLLFQKFKGYKKFHLVDAAAHLTALTFYVLLFAYGLSLFNGAHQTMPTLGIPKRWAYLSIPISGALLSLYALRDFAESMLRAFGKKRTEDIPS